eukprot:2680392-Lingulodinium_polyedra.AAC.1
MICACAAQNAGTKALLTANSAVNAIYGHNGTSKKPTILWRPHTGAWLPGSPPLVTAHLLQRG